MSLNNWIDDAVIGERRPLPDAWAWSVRVAPDGEPVDIEVRATDSAWCSRHPDVEEWVRERLRGVLLDNYSPASKADQLSALSPLWLRAPATTA